jgi:imidazolonepropionase-like amidohydrolase/ABC-type multidrug transport system permease subunit
MKPYLALISNNLRLAVRERSVIFFNYLFPLILFFALGGMFRAQGSGNAAVVVTMTLVIGIVTNGLLGVGLTAVQEREAGILRRFKVAPISPAPILSASLVTGWLLYLPNVVLTFGLAHYMWSMPLPRNGISLLVLLSAGVAAFRAIGLIVGAVANSTQESTILVQLIFMPTILLSGLSIPAALLPDWAQMIAGFLPASYLVTGLQGMILRGETLAANLAPLAALLATLVIAMFIAKQLFRWEKDERLRKSAKLWVAGVLLPFVILGANEIRSHGQQTRSAVLFRLTRRADPMLIRGARIFIGNGSIIEAGTVLVRNGKIEAVFEGPGPDPAIVGAEPIEAVGKTVLPGLIDVHVHAGTLGGVYSDPADYPSPDEMPARSLAQYLYSGVTAVKSVADPLETSIDVRDRIARAEFLGAEFFICGPAFTAEGGHGTEYFRDLPPTVRTILEAQTVRAPKNPAEARQQVRALKAARVDGLKAILEAGRTGLLFERLDLGVLQAIAAEARDQQLPLVVHTGSSQDLRDAIDAGVAGIEHGPRERLPDDVLQRLKATGTAYDPTLSVMEALAHLAEGNEELLDRALVQQSVPAKLLSSTRVLIRGLQGRDPDRAARLRDNLSVAGENLRRAHQAGVMLVTGSDAGNLLVFHGPTVHRELQLWVAAGVPPAAALQAATWNAARLLRAESRIGLIAPGYEASLLIVDGNPLSDISATERISTVIFKGERIRRADLFNERQTSRR